MTNHTTRQVIKMSDDLTKMADDAIKRTGAAVEVPPATDRYVSTSERLAAYAYVIDSIAGGLEYEGVVKWLSMHKTLREAVAAADREREGQIST